MAPKIDEKQIKMIEYEHVVWISRRLHEEKSFKLLV